MNKFRQIIEEAPLALPAKTRRGNTGVTPMHEFDLPRAPGKFPAVLATLSCPAGRRFESLRITGLIAPMTNGLLAVQDNDAVVAALERGDWVGALAAYAPQFTADMATIIGGDVGHADGRKIINRAQRAIEQVIAQANNPKADPESIDAYMGKLMGDAVRQVEDAQLKEAADRLLKAELLGARLGHGGAGPVGSPHLDPKQTTAPLSAARPSSAEALRVRQKRGRRSAELAPSPELYLTRAEAARLIRRSVGHLDLLRKDGVGPTYMKPGRSIMYKKTDVLDWMERTRVVPSPPLPTKRVTSKA